MVSFVEEEIVSRQNAGVKYAASLLVPKHRKESGAYRFEGVKLFAEAIKCGVSLERIFIDSQRREAILSSMDAASLSWREKTDATVSFLSPSVFASVSEEKSPEGIICVAKALDKSGKCDKIIDKPFLMKEKIRIMAAESIRDPGNVGSIIRSARAFGVDLLLLSSDCADVLSSKVIRSSMGAVFSLPVEVCASLTDRLTELKGQGYRVLATALMSDATPLSDMDVTAEDIFVIGNEGHGLSSNVISLADRCVYIDMDAGAGCESLNAGIAFAVCAWEQRKSAGEK